MEDMGIVEEWERSIVAENTRKHHIRSLRYFAEYMKEDPETLLKLRREQYGKSKLFETKTIEFYRWLQKAKGLSSNSARSTVIGVQSFFSYFDVPLKLRGKLPGTHMKLDEKKITIEDVRKLYKYNDLTVKTWISLSRDCPARIGDLLEIRRDQISPGFLTESQKEGVIGKVFLSEETIDLFHKLWKIVPESEYAFSTPSGKKYDQSSVAKMLKTAAKKADLEHLKIHQHSFRKLWITTAINLGLQTEVIKILSFKSVDRSLLTYFLDREDLRDEWKKVIDVLSLEPKTNGRIGNLAKEVNTLGTNQQQLREELEKTKKQLRRALHLLEIKGLTEDQIKDLVVREMKASLASLPEILPITMYKEKLDTILKAVELLAKDSDEPMIKSLLKSMQRKKTEKSQKILKDFLK